MQWLGQCVVHHLIGRYVAICLKLLRGHMSKNQGIIEFLAMSGILPLAIFLIIILGGIGFLLLAVFSMSKDKSASCAQQDGSECKRLDTYYVLVCPNDRALIAQGILARVKSCAVRVAN